MALAALFIGLSLGRLFATARKSSLENQWIKGNDQNQQAK
jgi:hypothetical protein